MSYAYNDIGNLLKRTALSGPGVSVTNTYGQTSFAGPHALTSALESTSSQPLQYGYEAGGRQKSGPGRTVTHNYFDLPSLIQPAAGVATSFKYDAFHQRVEKTGPLE